MFSCIDLQCNIIMVIHNSMHSGHLINGQSAIAPNTQLHLKHCQWYRTCTKTVQVLLWSFKFKHTYPVCNNICLPLMWRKCCISLVWCQSVYSKAIFKYSKYIARVKICGILQVSYLRGDFPLLYFVIQLERNFRSKNVLFHLLNLCYAFIFHNAINSYKLKYLKGNVKKLES